MCGQQHHAVSYKQKDCSKDKVHRLIKASDTMSTTFLYFPSPLYCPSYQKLLFILWSFSQSMYKLGIVLGKLIQQYKKKKVTAQSIQRNWLWFTGDLSLNNILLTLHISKAGRMEEYILPVCNSGQNVVFSTGRTSSADQTHTSQPSTRNITLHCSF